jgi:probable rRNA maturation factor
MDIHIFNHQNDLSVNESAIRSLAQLVIDGEGQSADEVAIHFISKEASGQLHARYFDDPAPTDCMSFPMDSPEESPRILGEIFVCPHVAQEFCSKGGVLPLHEEVALYVIHALLHLMGHDDVEDAAEKLMRERELLHLEAWRHTAQSVLSQQADSSE